MTDVVAGATGLLLGSSHAEPLAKELHTLLVLLRAEGHAHLRVDLPASGRFVEAQVFDDEWMCVQSVGDRFTTPQAPLTEVERLDLVRLGWEPPGSPPDGWWHWHREWEAADLHEVAQLLALTLVRVHHLVRPEDAVVAMARNCDAP